jgi:hypothetical protein
MAQDAPHTSHATMDELLGDRESRRLAASTVAASLIAWWPAFTLGVYGVVFFEQLLALWVAATVVAVVAAAVEPARAIRRPLWWALSLPSLWLVAAIVIPTGGRGPANDTLFWFGIVVTVVGLPSMAALLIRLLVPGAERLQGRLALIAIGVVLLVMAGSYLLGTQHERLLTCEDFTISGNFAPAGCTPEGSTD